MSEPDVVAWLEDAIDAVRYLIGGRTPDSELAEKDVAMLGRARDEIVALRHQRVNMALEIQILRDTHAQTRADALVDAAVAVVEAAADREEDAGPYVDAIRALKDKRDE
jgi:hypothetical protein